jgi:hypothetical protein
MTAKNDAKERLDKHNEYQYENHNQYENHDQYENRDQYEDIGVNGVRVNGVRVNGVTIFIVITINGINHDVEMIRAHQGGDVRGKIAWIQEDTEQDYSQTEYGKNALVVGDGGDGENPQMMLIQGDDDMRGRIALDLRG